MIISHFYPLEVVGHSSGTQLVVGEKLNYDTLKIVKMNL